MDTATTETRRLSLAELLANIEREQIIEALNRHRWNRTAAARDLGVTYRGLRYRIQRLGIK